MAEQPQYWVSTEALHPGMILAESVTSAGGMLLAPEGTALTRRHLRQMRLWGISGAQIVTTAEEHEATFAPTSAISQWLAIDERDPFMHELAELARDRYARYQQKAARERERSRV
jgi:hypothetical protein